jgi:small-conductance mechanosensitive channel
VNALSDILGNSGDTLGAFLPRLGAALLVLVVGLILVRVLGRLVARAIESLELERRAEGWGVHDALARIGLPRSLGRLVGALVRLIGSAIVILVAVSVLGLAVLSQSLNRGVLFLPQLFAAVALLVVGVVIGRFARERVERMSGQMDLQGPLGIVIDLAIVVVFALIALAQIGIPTGLFLLLTAIVSGGAALTVALAFGLGSRDVGRQLSAGRYVSAAFRIGQTISVDEVEGEIVAIEVAATVVRSPDGQTIRIPNHLLLGSIVTVGEAGPEAGRESQLP